MGRDLTSGQAVVILTSKHGEKKKDMLVLLRQGTNNMEDLDQTLMSGKTGMMFSM